MTETPTSRLAIAQAENDRKRATCPNRDQHMDRPRSYRDWTQQACPGCGLFVIWERLR